MRLGQAAVAQQPRRQVTGLSPAAFQAHHHPGLRERSGTLEIALLETQRGLGEDPLHLLMHPAGIATVRGNISPQHPAIGEILGSRRHRIGKPLLLAQLLEQPRRGSPADDIGEQLGGRGVRRAPCRRRHCDRDVRLLAFPAFEGLAADELRALGNRDLAVRHVAKSLLGEIDQLLVLELARGNEQETARRILRAKPGMQVVGRDRLDRVFASKNGPAERLACKGGFLKIVEDDVGCGVAGFGQFLKHHLLFELQMLRLEMRALDEVRKQTDAKRKVGRQQACVESRQLPVGRGIEVAADVLNQLADLTGRAAAGALEHHVLEQMGDAVEIRLLVPRPGRGVESDRHGFDAGHRPACDPEAVGEGGQLHHRGLAGSVASRFRTASA